MPIARPHLKISLLLLALAVLALHPNAAAAQQSATLVVRRAAGDSIVLGAADLARLPRHEVSASEHGRAGMFAGAWLRDVLAAAGVRVDSLRGPALATVIMVEAADGYRVAFSAGELSPDLGARAVLLADRRDGAPLGPSEGLLRLVLPDDSRPARWVRQVRAVSVIIPRSAAPTGRDSGH